MKNGNGVNGKHLSLAAVIGIIGVVVSALVFYFNDFTSLTAQVRVNAANIEAQNKQFDRIEKRLDGVDAKLDRVMGLLMKEK